jgi:hypothetical protein
MRGTWVMRGGKLVRKETAGPPPTAGKRFGSGASVISDTMGALRHPITGKPMDSKSQFRGVTRAHGCVEVGNEVQRDTRRTDFGNVKADIARAMSELGG